LERNALDICLEHLPDRPLRSSVECIWRTEPIAGTQFDIVPDGSVDACFVLSEKNPRLLLFGTTTKTSAYELEPGAIYFGVRFRPGEASSFIREKISDLTDTRIAVPHFLGITAEELFEIKNNADRRTRVQEALMRALSANQQQSAPVVDYAISQIDGHSGIRVREAAEACNISERQLERLFLHSVGVTPKLYMRIRRFRSVLNSLEDPPSQQPAKLADVAAMHGYVDQSHLLRDFQGFGYRLQSL
jgi:AraC-like DNA-binding protein